MKQLLIGTFAAFSAATSVAAPSAATVLFAQEGTQIVDTNGVARSAQKGDVVQSGERLITTTGSISQLQLPDGSLIGMRPGSEMRLSTDATSPQTAPLITLIQGAARVIGSELMDAKKISNITLQSGFATVRLQGADLESAVVRADKGANPVPGAAPSGPGSYQRLLIGSGSIGTGAQSTSLAPRQVNFVGSHNTPPTVIAAAMPAMTMSNRTPAAPQGGTTPPDTKMQSTPTAPPSRAGNTLVQPTPFTDRPLTTPVVRTPGAVPPAPTTVVQSPPVFTPIGNAPTVTTKAPTIAPVTLAPPAPSAPLTPAPTPTVVIPTLPTLPTAPILTAVTTPSPPILTTVSFPTTPVVNTPPLTPVTVCRTNLVKC